jgi:MFS family permease
LALPIRGLVFASVTNPYALVAAQLLDGITGAVFAVMVPLIIADLTRGTGHFSLGQGFVGTSIGIGASVSTTYAGYLSDHFGDQVAFLGLTAVAILGLATVVTMMPETQIKSSISHSNRKYSNFGRGVSDTSASRSADDLESVPKLY